MRLCFCNTLRVSKFTGVLAHYQDRSARATDLIPSDVADQLVQRMAAERISRRIIRLLSPDSVFLPAKAFRQPQHQQPETPLNLPMAEIHGLRFLPSDPARARAARRADAMACIQEYVWA